MKFHDKILKNQNPFQRKKTIMKFTRQRSAAARRAGFPLAPGFHRFDVVVREELPLLRADWVGAGRDGALPSGVSLKMRTYTKGNFNDVHLYQGCVQ